MQPGCALSPYRVLDLTESGCQICGKILADLGADVIQIERPTGSASRNMAPFSGKANIESSFYWLAYNANKRGITLNIETKDGQVLFKKLIQKADFIIESFPPGYLANLGLGYEIIRAIHPRTILTSITPYGQTGPYCNYKASELTLWAMGGYSYLNGDPDRPPVWLSFPQAYLNGGAEAAAASMIAHYYRELSGEGQHVDISIREAVIWYMSVLIPYWDLAKIIVHRVGAKLPTVTSQLKMVYQCKDGYIAFQVWGGSDMSQVATMRAFVKWMDEEGAAPAWLREFDWVNDYDSSKVTQALVNKVEGVISDFMQTKPKKELFQQAIARRIMLAPVNDTCDLLNDEQLADRNFWAKLYHQDLGKNLTYCGPFVKMTETPIKEATHAPMLGQHNEEIYINELGLSAQELVVLKAARVI